jgi:hypothetical protein
MHGRTEKEKLEKHAGRGDDCEMEEGSEREGRREGRNGGRRIGAAQRESECIQLGQQLLWIGLDERSPLACKPALPGYCLPHTYDGRSVGRSDERTDDSSRQKREKRTMPAVTTTAAAATAAAAQPTLSCC